MGLLSKLLGKKSKNEMINPMDGLNELQKAIFYIEAIIGLENHISQKLAKKFINNYSKKITDSHSGQPAYQYIDLFQS